MPLTDREHHDAYQALRATFGEQTDAVIDLLRPAEDRLATKDDLALLEANLRGELADLRTDMGAELAAMRTEMRAELTALRTEMRAELTALRAEMGAMNLSIREDFHRALAAQTRTMMIALITAIVLMAITATVGPIAG